MSDNEVARAFVAVLGAGIGFGLVAWARRTGAAPSASASSLKKAPYQARAKVLLASPRAATGTGLAGGLLLRETLAGRHEAPTWVDVPLLGTDLVMSVGADNLRASATPGGGLLRLPVTWPETVSVARALGDVIAPSQRMVDSIRAAAKVKTALHGQGTGAMMAVATSEAFEKDVDGQIAKKGGSAGAGDLISGHEKYWILHPRLDQAVNDASLRASGLPLVGPNPAVNYGGFGEDGKIIQTVGGRHNSAHYDYSQLFRAVKRWAKRADGTSVDLLAWIEDNEHVPRAFTDLFRSEAAVA